MAEPLRKPVEPLVSDDPLEIAPLPGTPPAYDESEVRRMKRESQPALVNAAETVGSTVGSAVGTIRDKVHSGLGVVKKRSADNGMNVDELNETVRTRANEAAENIRARTNEVTEATSRRIREWSGATQRRIEMLRTRGKEFSRERPAELILVIGGIAMVAGIILRLWRSNRD
jgi:ElaB/YqjD/DUF883 family membrane-anchored ribosome-binding protein